MQRVGTAAECPGVTMALSIREQRQQRRSELRSRGIRPAKIRRVWCVKLTALVVPQWALDRRVPGLSGDVSRVWLRPRDARFLLQLDRAAGGEPWFAESEYRRCGVCGRPLIGEDAAARRKLDESGRTARQIPCGDTCLDAARDRRWRN